MSQQVKPRCLIWTGPRLSDIQDCEEGLFIGSITLYGEYRDENNRRTFDKPGTLVDKETVDAFNTLLSVTNNDSKSPNTGLENTTFNYSFCESDFFYGKLRINHNAEDPLSDLFIVMEQVKLLASELQGNPKHPEVAGCELYFMAYNPNFAVCEQNDEPVEMLESLLKCEGHEGEFAEPEKWGCDNATLRNAIKEHSKYLKWGNDEFRKEELQRVKEAYGILKKKYGDKKRIASFIGSRTVCINNKNPSLVNLMKELNDKARFREMCRMVGVPTTESITVIGAEEEASVAALKHRLGGSKFVVQHKKSSGGFGTYLFKDPYEMPGLPEEKKGKYLDNENYKIRKAMIGADRESDGVGESSAFVLSRYRDPNIPVNVHVMIGEYDILKSPYSIQVITNIDGKLIYSGADFIAFEDYARENRSTVKKMDTYVDWLAKYLQGRQYRGIVGFDIIISGNQVEFVEANNRFQASTVLLNLALKEKKYLKDDKGRIKVRVDSNFFEDKPKK